MNAKLALHPQLHGIGNKPVAAPMRRARHVYGDRVGFRRAGTAIGNSKAPRFACDRGGQRFARLHRLTLLAGPGAEPALPGPGAKILIALVLGQPFDSALGSHLTVTMVPMKY